VKGTPVSMYMSWLVNWTFVAIVSASDIFQSSKIVFFSYTELWS
jgi:hypothetical protein